MPTATATAPVTVPIHAGVLNYLGRTASRSALINDVQSEIPAGHDTLLALAGQRLVRLLTVEDVPTDGIGDAYRVQLTGKGWQWAISDQLNNLMLYVFDAPGRRAKLSAHDVRGTDPDIIALAIAKRFLTTHRASDGRDAVVAMDDIRRASPHYELRSTNHSVRWAGR